MTTAAKRIALFAGCFSIAAAMGDVLRYGTAETPVDGTVELSDGTVATGVEAHIVEGSELILTNGDLRLDAPAADVPPEIVRYGGGVRVASDVSAPDGLVLRSDSKTLVQENFYPQAWNHSPTATLFATGKNLDEYVPGVGKRSTWLWDMDDPQPGYPFIVKRSPGELTFEMQYINDYLRSIKVRLFQVGEDIYAQVLWARYANAAKGYGFSLENSYTGEVPVNSKTHQPTANNQTWFGVHTLVLLHEPDLANMTVVSGNLSVSGGLSLENVDASIEGNALAGVSSVPITVSNSMLRVSADTEATLDSPLTVSDATLRFGGKTVGNNLDETSGAIVTIGSSKSTLFYNTHISGLEITGAYVRQGTGAAIMGDKSWFGYYEKVDDGITFQAQGQSNDGWNKCALVSIWQEGSNIVGQVTGKPYNYVSKSPLGTDMRLPENVKGQGDYNATNITYNLVCNMKASLHLTGTVNGCSANAVVESNALVYVDSRYALPVSTQGVVTVERGGEMYWCAPNASSAKELPTFCVRGRLVYCTTGYRDGSHYDIDGGVLSLINLGEGNSTSEAGQYLNSLTYRDGARLTGRRPRVGTDGNCTWVVEGTSPSYWESGGRLVGMGNATAEGSRSFTVQVADVTGDGEADFISLPASFSGYPDSLFTDYYSNLMRLKIIKAGAGTWEWRAKGGTWTGRLVLKEGVVRFTKSASLATNGLGLYFDGGELQLAAGTTNSVPKVVVAADSTLSLGGEAVVEFPDSVEDFTAGTVISNGVTFAVNGPNVRVGRRTGVRFGASACLSDDLLSRIRYNDMRVRQDSEGWLTPSAKGIMIKIQ
jgi:hypothetical protein